MNIVPQHVGLILDGNRRWAKERGLETLEGHKAGYENLKKIGDHLLEKGVKYVSAFVFSTENWKRTKPEVKYLMDLALWAATEEVEEFVRRGVQVRFIGERQNLSRKLQKAITEVEARSKDHSKGVLALCFNYGGRAEIVQAVKSAADSGEDISTIDEETISKHLWAADIPDVDLVIRTAGEQRISNFMLWRVAYSELYFVDPYWPALTTDDIDEVLAWYAGRERRFGGDSKKK